MNKVDFEVATLGGGCFWCLEAVYQEVEGVERVVSGYAGGTKPDPTYEQVCTGTTGHAEVVQIFYDPEVLTFRELLEIFFSIHDPTTPDRQGGDVGPQYRSIILYHTDLQREIAESIIVDMEAEHIWTKPVVTEVAPFDVFYEAEAYHQNYFRNHPTQGYCQSVINPKLDKFRKTFRQRLRA